MKTARSKSGRFVLKSEISNTSVFKMLLQQERVIVGNLSCNDDLLVRVQL